MFQAIFDAVIPGSLLLGALYFSIFSLIKKWTVSSVYKKTQFVIIVLFCLCSALLLIFNPLPLYSTLLGVFALIMAVLGGMPDAKAEAETGEKPSDDKPLMEEGELSELQKKILMFSVFNNLQDIALVINGDGMVVFMNEVAVKRLGDHVGLPMIDALQADDAERVVNLVRSNGELDESPIGMEMLLRGRDYDVSLSRIRKDKENKAIFLGRDVTEKKIVERQMMINEKMLSLGQLVAGVAHEISNPIAYVVGNVEFLELLQSKVGDYYHRLENLIQEAEGESSSDIIANLKGLQKWAKDEGFTKLVSELPAIIDELGEGLNRVKMIVKDLKEFSHSGAEAPEETDINEIIRLTLRIARNEVSNISSALIELDESLPMINAYPQQLKQVFLNLVINALHAMKGEEDSRLEIKSVFKAPNLVITIHDNGCGMAEELRRRIFEPFFTTKEVGKGTGLGLAVVEAIIQRHEGRISVDSAPGEGSTFTITLPRVTTKESEKLLEETKRGDI